MNRTFVAAAGSVIAAVGVKQLSAVTGRSPACLDAIRAGMPDAAIQAACGDIGTLGLLGIIVTGAVVFLLIQFWKDIATSIDAIIKSKTE